MWDNFPSLTDNFDSSTMADFETLFPDWIRSAESVAYTPSPRRKEVGTMAGDHILLLERCQSQSDTTSKVANFRLQMTQNSV